MLSLNDLMDNLYQKHLATIAIDRQDEELKTRFEEYMKGKYLKFYSRIADNDSCKGEIFEDWYDTEERHWGGLSNDEKYAKFTEDTALVEIDRLSGIVFGVAKEKLQGKIQIFSDISTLRSYVDEMKKMEDKTFVVNRYTAHKLISEAIVEIEYISEKTTNLSMRLGNIAKYIHN